MCWLFDEVAWFWRSIVGEHWTSGLICKMNLELGTSYTCMFRFLDLVPDDLCFAFLQPQGTKLTKLFSHLRNKSIRVFALRTLNPGTVI